MQTLTSGTITGAGSFRCQNCDYVQTLIGSETTYGLSTLRRAKTLPGPPCSGPGDWMPAEARITRTRSPDDLAAKRR